MPELPEVETVRRGLESVVPGRRIGSVLLSDKRLRFPYPEHFAERLDGRVFGVPARRAKYLLLPLDGQETLIVHLGMSGSLRVQADGRTLAHDHVRLDLGERELIYHDPRRFGLMTLHPTDRLAEHALLKDLGPEPLGETFTAKDLLRAAQGKSIALKPFLMDQKTVVGVGNIYASEALFRSRISPFIAAGDLTAKQAELLVPAIRAVLEEAIASGGSTLRDYARPDSKPGYFQHRFEVYDRNGQPCVACGTDIRKKVQAQRATYWCAECQEA